MPYPNIPDWYCMFSYIEDDFEQLHQRNVWFCIWPEPKDHVILDRLVIMCDLVPHATKLGEVLVRLREILTMSKTFPHTHAIQASLFLNFTLALFPETSVEHVYNRYVHGDFNDVVNAQLDAMYWRFQWELE